MGKKDKDKKDKDKKDEKDDKKDKDSTGGDGTWTGSGEDGTWTGSGEDGSWTGSGEDGNWTESDDDDHEKIPPCATSCLEVFDEDKKPTCEDFKKMVSSGGCASTCEKDIKHEWAAHFCLHRSLHWEMDLEPKCCRRPWPVRS